MYFKTREFFQNRKYEEKKNTVIFRHFYISSSSAPEEFLRVSSGFIMCYNINVDAKLYILGRVKVFSNVETYFWSSTIGNHVKYVDEMC